MFYIRQHHFIYIVTLLHVAALKWPSLGSTDMFREQGQQNTFSDVSIRLKNSVLYVTWHIDMYFLTVPAK
jgi:hypothetical protein